MVTAFDSKVEQAFYKLSGMHEITTKLSCSTVDKLLRMSLITSIWFPEGAEQSPNEVIGLPTGKIPEYF